MNDVWIGIILLLVGLCIIPEDIICTIVGVVLVLWGLSYIFA